MDAPRIFLDTQQWNYLVSKPGCSDEKLASARGLLKQRVASGGGLVVVGSLPVLQELMATAPRNSEKYEQMRQLAFDVVGRHWLLPLDQRYVGEIALGRLLPENARYLSRDMRRKITRLARKPNQVHEVADATHAETEKFKVEQESIRECILHDLGLDEQPRNMRVEMEKWWNRRDLEGWVEGIVKSGMERGHLPSGTPYVVSEATMPSAWRLTDFKQARIRLNLGEGRSIKPGDYVDAAVYGVTPYVDTLFTDDAAFRATCQLLDNDRLLLSDFDGLLALLHEEQ